MRNVVAISLPDNLSKKLTKEAKHENTSKSEIVRRSLQQHFFVRDFDQVCKKASGELARKGIILTEEEVFKKVS